jgi:cytochrome c5
MKKISALAATLLFAVTAIAYAHIPPVGAPKYIGAEKCKMCHNSKGQWAPWEKSKHALAFEALKTEAADKLAAEKGFKTKVVETPECVACHQTGRSVKDAVYDEKFNV